MQRFCGLNSDAEVPGFRISHNDLGAAAGSLGDTDKSQTKIVPNCFRTPILKFHFEILLFGWTKGF